jgi:hypothetical protein
MSVFDRQGRLLGGIGSSAKIDEGFFNAVQNMGTIPRTSARRMPLVELGNPIRQDIPSGLWSYYVHSVRWWKRTFFQQSES